MYNVESEIEETYYDSAEGSSSGASSKEWEDESDSWETDNGQVEEEPDGEETISISSSTTATTSDEKTNGILALKNTDSTGTFSSTELAGGIEFSYHCVKF